MMRTSIEIAELAAALAKAQAQIKGATKSADNPFFHSRYADLASTWDACREALTSNGLAIVQSPEGNDPQIVTVTTRLCHSSGQWMEGSLAMRPVKDDPQGTGSTITYARRYALAAIVGVAPEDDDANAASNNPHKAAPVQHITEKQGFDLQSLIEEVGADEAAFLGWLKVESIEAIPAARYAACVQALEKKRAKVAT